MSEFEVLTALNIFWDMRSCSPGDVDQCLHLQGGKYVLLDSCSLLFRNEDGGGMLLQTISELNYKASYPKR
jgi:hypothetical protein